MLEQTVEWQVPKHPGVSMPIPKGWRARGSITKQIGYWALSVEAIDPGPERRYISWRQPITPLFRELTTLLEGIGYKEFDRYSSDAGGESYVLQRRPTVQSFLTGYWNTQTRVGLQSPRVVEQTKAGELAALLGADTADTVLATVRGESVLGVRENIYAAALAKAEHAGLHNWWAAVLEAGGPSGDIVALNALRTMVQGVSIADGETDLDPDFDAIIAAAKRAAQLLPARADAGNGDTESVLKLRISGDQRTWTAPAGALRWWGAAGADGARYAPEMAPLLSPDNLE
jgi:hypothetical protein